MSRRSIAHGALAGLILALAIPALAIAHAGVATSDPEAGAVVVGPFEGPIVVEFTEAVAEGSGLVLVDTSETELGVGAFDPSMPTMIVLDLDAPIGPGEYLIRWTIRSDDGHVERGTIGFSVVESTPEPTTGPSTEPSTAATAAPTAVPATPAPSIDGDDDGATGDVLLPIAVLGVLLAAGFVLLVRRRGATR